MSKKVRKTEDSLKKLFHHLRSKSFGKIKKEFLAVLVQAEAWRREDLKTFRAPDCGSCLQCCTKMPIVYTSLEQRVLRDALSKVPKSLRGQIKDRAASLIEKWKTVCREFGTQWWGPIRSRHLQKEWVSEKEWCPLFVNGFCALHSARPIFCRINPYRVCEPDRTRALMPLRETIKIVEIETHGLGNQDIDFRDIVVPSDPTTVESILVNHMRNLDECLHDSKSSISPMPILRVLA